ncbi:hypothetical protein MHY_00980 [Megamonas hypermegale ART12/1]|nr:hypothetical protein MHY_00980 [Megamonas hypermegale ART12/1]
MRARAKEIYKNIFDFN